MSETHPQPLTCAFHPKRETSLRCNRCNKPICIKCATHTPTGYRCPECIRAQQKVFITARWPDYLIAVAITGVISFLGSLLASILGFLILFIGAAAGSLAVTAVKKAISNRRSPLLNWVMIGTAFAASLPLLLIRAAAVLPFLFEMGFAVSGVLYSLLWYVAYTVLVTTTVYYRLRN